MGMKMKLIKTKDDLDLTVRGREHTINKGNIKTNNNNFMYNQIKQYIKSI